MTDANLDGRLLSAAGFVRQGAVFADIGTDHAYLPLFLLKEGKIARAVCSDIAKGPLENAVNHAKSSAYYDKMSFHLTKGLMGLQNEGITDVAVCGMGGELIRDILSESPFIKDKKIRLILNPMSKQETLRSWLFENGFEIEDEAYSKAEGKFYVTLCATYTGKTRILSDTEALFGSLTDDKIKTDSCAKGYLEKKRKALAKASAGKAEGGDFDNPERKLLLELDKTFPSLKTL